MQITIFIYKLTYLRKKLPLPGSFFCRNMSVFKFQKNSIKTPDFELYTLFRNHFS